jgi:hypothetical protein
MSLSPAANLVFPPPSTGQLGKRVGLCLSFSVIKKRQLSCGKQKMRNKRWRARRMLGSETDNQIKSTK